MNKTKICIFTILHSTNIIPYFLKTSIKLIFFTLSISNKSDLIPEHEKSNSLSLNNFNNLLPFEIWFSLHKLSDATFLDVNIDTRDIFVDGTHKYASSQEIFLSN